MGEYELAGTTITTAIRADQTLVVIMPGQPEYELTYTGNHTFAIKKLSGYTVQFDTNDKGEVIAMTSVQPSGNFKATRKAAKSVAEAKN